MQDSTYIFCAYRKKWLILTPEEWVRQNTLAFLNQNLKYPIHLINTEVPIKINKLSQRMDIVIYKEAKPFILCECKKPKVKITQETLDQALRYNNILNAEWVYLTNGIQHIVAKKEKDNVSFYKTLPLYS